MIMKNRQLVLEDGTVFIGKGFGSDIIKYGEVIFNTNMTGYQEMITDPANLNQIIVTAYPVIGSYGINRDDSEAINPSINGLVVKEINEFPSNFRNEESLSDYMKTYEIPGISGIDTRYLIQLLRDKGTLKGAIASLDLSKDVILSRLKNKHSVGDEVSQSSIAKPYIVPGSKHRIVAVDLGMKQSVLKELTGRNCDVTVVPYDYSASQILRFKPDGVIISNGPGDPQVLESNVEVIKELIGKTSLLGVGLGHQLFALANGAKIDRMKYGNHSSSYPVREIKSGVSRLTMQNCHFTVNLDSLTDTDLVITHEGLNDQSIQGLALTNKQAMSVQFNPEGAPGTNEANEIFDVFLSTIKDN